MPLLPSPRRALAWCLRLSLAAPLALSVGVAPAFARAEIDADAAFWSRIDQLVERQAFPAARAELSRALARPAFAARWGDRAHWMAGVVARHMGETPRAIAELSAVPSDSRYYLNALTERASLAREQGDEGAAIAWYERVLALAPESEKATARGALADLYFTRGLYAKALDQYRELANAYGPGRERALFAWGWTLVRVGEEAAAINVWKQAVERYPTSRYAQAVRLALGNLLLARGDHLSASTYYNEAARDGENAAESEALMARAELLAGEAYAESKDYALALVHYRAVADDDALAEPARYGEAYAQWQLGKLPEAQEAFTAWLARFPRSLYRAGATFALGEIARVQGDRDGAVTAYQRADFLAPKSAWAEEALYRLAQLAFEGRDYTGAIAHGRALEERFARSAYLGPALYMRGESHMALNQYADAIRAYSQLAVLGRSEFLLGAGAAVDYKIGLAHFYAGNYAEAARVLETASDSPLAEDALFWQAEARYRSGQYDLARNVYSRLIARYGDYSRLPEAFYGLGWACVRLSDYQGAKVAFSEASKRLGEGRLKQDATYRWGLAQIDLKDWEGARATLGALLEANPDPELTASARFQISWSFYRQGRLDDAAQAFGQFVAVHGGHALAPQALLWQGRSLFRLGRYAEAITSLNAVIEHSLVSAGQRYEAREQLAAAYHNAGRFDEARGVYEQLLGAGELSAERQEELKSGVVQSLIKAGRYREARSELMKKTTFSEADRAVLRGIGESFFTQGAWDEVITTYQAMPQPPVMLSIWAGKSYLEKKAYPEAAKVLSPLRDLSDRELRSGVLYDLATAQRGARDYAGARTTLLALSDANAGQPLAATALLEAADVAALQRDWSGAQALYRRIGENRTFSLDKRRTAWMSLGDLHRGQKQWGPALLAYRGARGLGPNGSLGAALGGYWAGVVLVEMKQYREALKELTSLRFPEDAEPLPSLAALKQGEALERLNRWKEAQELYSRVMTSGSSAERAEARSRFDWIEKNVPKEMRS